ncbi:MAG TPA: sigma-70 family RNA polymerase sigma factor [Planctomycetota bacterium]|nr:sigma-70 family RNA polymerase sigma factor [Planctomycetota bacterium]
MEPRAEFQSTLWSVVLRAREGNAEERRAALERLCEIYWPPLYAYLLRKGHPRDQAQDLVQGFFAYLLEKELMDRADPERGRFRNFLKSALKNFLADEHRAAGRQKRGGGKIRIPIDAEVAPLEEMAAAPGHETPEACFDRAWANEILAAALFDLQRILKEEKREAAFQALELYDLAPPPGESLGYREVAQRLKRSEAEVKADLAYARQRLRQALAERVRLYCEDDQDVFKELNDILSL